MTLCCFTKFWNFILYEKENSGVSIQWNSIFENSVVTLDIKVFNWFNEDFVLLGTNMEEIEWNKVTSSRLHTGQI